MKTAISLPPWLPRALGGVVSGALMLAAAASAQTLATDWSLKPLSAIRLGAERGDPVAMRLLANSYLSGEGVPQDPAEAAKWLAKSAEKNDVLAQFILGILYQEGRGVKRDSYEAAKWYRAAASQGLPEAQYNLGHCYATGEGVIKDLNEAINWFKKAATAGDKDAQTRLGLAYITGNGVPQDNAEAATWLRKAAYQYDPVAMFFFGRLYQEGKGVAKEPVDAAKWFRRAAEAGHADAQYALGICYQNGEGVAKDPAQATSWLQKAAAQGHKNAISQLAYLGVSPAKGAADTTTAPSLPPPTRAEVAPAGSSFRADPVAPRAGDSLLTPVALPLSPPARPGDANPLRPETAPATNAPPGAGSAFRSESTDGFFSGINSRPALTNAPKDDFLTPPRDTGKETLLLPPAKESPPPLLSTNRGALKEPTVPAARDLGALLEPPKKGDLLPPPDTALRPGVHDYVPGAMTGEERGVTNTIAVVVLVMAVVIAFLCILILVTFRKHITSLEMEIKKTQFELSKANVNLSAVVKQVEALSLGEAHTPKQIELPDWLKDNEENKTQPRGAAKSSGFKSKR